jgi:Ca2+-binding RTX toxin-like protein
VPVYSFETITAAQAAGFRASADTLSFNATTTPQLVTVTYGDTGATLVVGQHSVVFGSGFLGASMAFPDGSKLVVGGPSADLVSGTAAADQLLGGDGGDTLQGLDGIDVLRGGPGVDSLSGGGGNDALDGGAGSDTLDGGVGNDTLDGGEGTDSLDGGAGFDVVSFASSSAGVQASLATATQVGEGGDRFVNVEGLQGGVFADQLSGDDQANLLLGGDGTDTVMGLGGDDSVEGGRGDDLLDGGAGSDTLVFTTADSGVFVDLETRHTVSFDTVLGQDTVSGFENAIGTAFSDAMLGDTGANGLHGLDGADSLDGAGGGDTLDGGAGGDILTGGDGQDDLIGGPGADTMEGGADFDIYEFSAGDSPADGLVTALDRIKDFGGDILVFHGGVAPTEANYTEAVLGLVDPRTQAQELLAKGYEYVAIQVGGDVEVFAARLNLAILLKNSTLDAIGPINIRNEVPRLLPAQTPSAGDDVLTGSGNDTIDGLAGNDTITEASGRNYLRGGEGGDSIVGGTGFDDINGNAGNDTCVSGGGDDWVVGGKDNDSLVGSDGQNLVYGNLGSDTCDGGAGNDIVRGGQDDDVVMGGAGDDFVSGDKGSDTMTGGAGADVFHTFGDAGIDRVTDFHASEGDRVQLDPGTVYTVAQAGADTVISMTGGGQMTLVGVTLSSLPSGWIFGA